MTNFSYNQDIPDAPNNPSDDQPLMKTNTNSTFGIIAVDHVGFEQANGGYHTVIHQGPAGGGSGSDPAAIPGFGQTYVKTVGSTPDQQLFFETGLGVVSQLTPSSTILSGTYAMTLAFANFPPLSPVPANSIGYVLFYLGTTLLAHMDFSSLAGVLECGTLALTAGDYSPQGAQYICQASGLNLQVVSKSGTPTLNYKIIYISL
jgi:hypothetical protein